MTEAFVDIKNVTKIFVQGALPAIDLISAIFPRGKIIGLVGPDGAGKTTLIRLMAGLLKPTAGSITVSGLDTIKDAKSIHEIIGYMPQKFGLYEDLTVLQNLNLYADLRGVIGKERKDTYEKLLSFTNLKKFVDRLAGALSGGMKQKLGLACALICKPALLLLDEPSVGVDPISRRELWSMVQELVDTGISVVWSTAYLDEAEKCQMVLLLNDGKLLYYGPPGDLTEKFSGHSYRITDITTGKRNVLQKVLSNENVIDGVIYGSDVRIVFKDESKIDSLGDDFKLVETPPRFEDAFMNILREGMKSGFGGKSELAERSPMHVAERDTIIEANNLVKKFGSFTAASNITLGVKPGEIFGLLGPNGAGKSTTFKMMCGLLKPTSGDAIINGYNLQTAPGEARSSIGYMAQKFSLYGNLSVKQNLEFFSGVYNLSGKERKNAVDQMIEIFNFQEYLDVSADMLPLGYKQRLALSCALMHNPKVIFLDEPTSGVDPITRREFWNHINGLVGKGATVMVTTHFMDEAEYCDRIALIYQSKIITIGTPDSLKEMAKTAENQTPTLEDAFIYLIEQYDMANNGS